jgi:RimJ/RimL family protein N-acetyltransferase
MWRTEAFARHNLRQQAYCTKETPLPSRGDQGVGAMETLRCTAGYAKSSDPSRFGRLREELIPLQANSDYTFYRRLIHLKNGKRLMLRFLTEGDRQSLIDLFQKATWEDLWFFRHDLKNRSLLNYWLNHLDYQHVLPLVAMDLEDNQLVAAAVLWRGKRTAQHIGEIKIFISQQFRNLGLGSKILDELNRFANQEKLHWVKAELVTDQKQLVKALRNKGFQIRATLEDFFMRQDGKTHDVLWMMLCPSEGKQEPS